MRNYLERDGPEWMSNNDELYQPHGGLFPLLHLLFFFFFFFPGIFTEYAGEEYSHLTAMAMQKARVLAGLPEKPCSFWRTCLYFLFFYSLWL